MRVSGETNVEKSEEVTGYTEEEFRVMAELLGLGRTVKNVWVQTESTTPEYRLKLIQAYRRVLESGDY